MSLLLATQITAVATAILAGGAIVTAIFAILAFRKQAVEVDLLQKQAERDLDQRRRAQAAQVFVWVAQGDDGLEVRVMNSSQQPIYDVIVKHPKVVPIEPIISVVEPVRLNYLLPTKQVSFKVPPGELPPVFAVAEIEFRDASGVRWMTSNDGSHIELPPRPRSPILGQ
jgi:hypothetical protein